MDLNIVVGYFCNEKCHHCATRSGPKLKHTGLTDREIDLLVNVIEELQPTRLLFTGGEPTFYIDKIAEILSRATDKGYSPITIVTTNGWFADRSDRLESIFTKFTPNEIQLSIDTFHKLDAAETKMANLKKFCERKAIGFKALLTADTPESFIKYGTLANRVGVRLIVQKLARTGRALDLSISYSEMYPAVELANDYCPNRGSLTFIAGKGFSVCCSSLAFDRVPGSYVHSRPEEHFESRFYELISNFKFSEIAEKLSTSGRLNSQQFGHVCDLCSNIFPSELS